MGGIRTRVGSGILRPVGLRGMYEFLGLRMDLAGGFFVTRDNARCGTGEWHADGDALEWVRDLDDRNGCADDAS
jgi:hypothetical protein